MTVKLTPQGAYEQVLRSAHMARAIARGLDEQGYLDDALSAIDRADSVGIMLDPTLYRANARRMHEDREVIAALRALARLGEADRG